MRVVWGMARSPFGVCSIGWCERGICHLAFQAADITFPDRLASDWPRAEFQRNDRAAKRLAEKIFFSAEEGKFLVFVRGSEFQRKIWRALARIPAGSVTGYGSIAEAVGVPGASRAVGGACAANPVAYLIPCHRVIRSDGRTMGYRWGDERKIAILAAESVL